MLKSFIRISKKNPCCMQFSSRNVKVFKFIPTPVKKTTSESQFPSPTKINEETAKTLEKISLVGFENEKGIQIVEDAIRFADQIFQVNTDDVKPLVSILEQESLYLREDTPNLDATRSEILSHSAVTEENYFITPCVQQTYVPKEDTVVVNREQHKEKVY